MEKQKITTSTFLLLFTAYSASCGASLQAPSKNTVNRVNSTDDAADDTDEVCSQERISVDALGGLCNSSVCYQTRLYRDRETGGLVIDTGNSGIRVVVEDAPFIDDVYSVNINNQRTTSPEECGSLEDRTDRDSCYRTWQSERNYRGLAEMSRLALDRAERRAERQCGENYRRRGFAYRPRSRI
jgi:hypothetical protein